MTERPWYKRYPSDFIAGTVGMSLELKGAYSLVLDVIYDRGRPVPDDVRYWSGICGVSVRKWCALRDELVARGKISVSADGMIMNFRAEKEIKNAEKTAEKLAENGAKGARKRDENRAASNKNNGVAQAGLDPLARAPVQKPESREERDTNVSPKKTAKGTRLDAGWRLPGAWGRWALEEFPNATEAAVRQQAASFRDYWISKSGQNATKLDWEATWRNWCRKAFTPPARGPTAPPKRTERDVINELRAQIDGEDIGNGTAPAERNRAPDRQLSIPQLRDARNPS